MNVMGAVSAPVTVDYVQGGANPQNPENGQSFSECLRSEQAAVSQPDGNVRIGANDAVSSEVPGAGTGGVESQPITDEITELAFIYPRLGLAKGGENAGDETEISAEEEPFPSKRALSQVGTEGSGKNATEGGGRLKKADAEREKTDGTGAYAVHAAVAFTETVSEFSSERVEAADTVAGAAVAPGHSAPKADVPAVSPEYAPPATERSDAERDADVGAAEPDGVFAGEIFAKDVVSVKTVKIPVAETDEADGIHFGAMTFAKPVIKESAELNELVGKADIPASAAEVSKSAVISESAEDSKDGENSEEQKSDGKNNSAVIAPDGKPLNREPVSDFKLTEFPTLPRQLVGPITEKLEALGGGDTVTEFEVTLHPAELGKVTVKLIAKGAGVAVEVIAENPKTRELLADRSGAVRQSLESRGVTVEKYEVSGTGAYETSEKYRDFSDSQGHGQNRDGYNGQSQDDDDDGEPEVSFAEIVGTMI